MKSNAAMRSLLANVGLIHPLNSKLSAIVGCGFEARDGCYFLVGLMPSTANVTRTDFQDCTGYECFVNSIHIEDYENEAPLGQAVRFVEHVFAAWRASTSTTPLISIVSVDEPSVVVKFHVKRHSEEWLSRDLDRYDDAIMSMESSDDLLSPMTAILQSAKNMFSAYLNQDFDLLFGTADNAIRAFVQQSSSDEVSSATKDIEKILSMKLLDVDVRKLVLQDLGSCYYYPNEWNSGELWLKHVLNVLRE